MPSGFSQEAEQIRDLTSGESQAGWPPPNMKTEGGSGQNVESENTPGNLEKEEALGGPMFCPPLYKQRYAAVANVIQDKQCKKVNFQFSRFKLALHRPLRQYWGSPLRMCSEMHYLIMGM